MRKLIFFIFLTATTFSCTQTPKMFTEKKSRLYTSPNKDYSIDLGKKWSISHEDTLDSPYIVISTSEIDLNDIKMLRIYQEQVNDSTAENRMEKNLKQKKDFYQELKILKQDEIVLNGMGALSIEYEFMQDFLSYRELMIVIESKNGNIYFLELHTSNNEKFKLSQNELMELAKTFRLL